MRSNEALSILFAGLLLFGATTVASAQTNTDAHGAHHPSGEKTPPPEGMQGGMPGMGAGMGEGMGMMTPEMMQRMMSQGGMSGMMGGMQGRGMSDDGEGPAGMGPGMMGPGMIGPGMMAPGMMGRMPMAGGMMMCPMMQMTGPRAGMGIHAMPGGDAMLYGMRHGKAEEMTPQRVRALLEQRLDRHGNPRLRLGSVETTEDGSIVAEIVTVDGSLVQKLAFNRYPGLFRQIDD